MSNLAVPVRILVSASSASLNVETMTLHLNFFSNLLTMFGPR